MECQVHTYENCFWNGKFVCEKCPKVKLIGPPVYYSGLSEDMTTRMMSIRMPTPKMMEATSEVYTATLDGLFNSYIDHETDERVRLDSRSMEKVNIPIDANSGAILLAFIGGKGKYTLNFYCNNQLLLEVANCEHNLFRLKLSD
jgi:hypothetical protein